MKRFIIIFISSVMSSLTTISCPTRSTFTGGMGINSLSISLEDINNETDATKKRALENRFIREKISEGYINQAMDIVHYRTERESKQLIAGTYIEYAYYNEGRSKINEVTGTATEDVRLKNFMHTVADAYEANAGHLALDTAQEQTIRTTENCTSPVNVNGQAVLEVLELNDYRRIPKKYGSTAARIPNNENDVEQNKQDEFEMNEYKVHQEILLKVIPNPFESTTEIIYHLDTDEKGVIQIIDTYGRVVKEYNVADGNSIIVSKNDLGSDGMYYILYKHGNKLEREKIILLR